ncbi:hypothetical protein HK096_003573 [Nowakowskiella sp. JEL0078]|nr:hypothetical protein HK096_003573 [Nowakowskiella sp. JEL0078]
MTEGKNALTEVAKEMAWYFHDVDWAPTDILVGMILVKRTQKRQRYEESVKRAILHRRRQRLGLSSETLNSTTPSISRSFAESSNLSLRRDKFRYSALSLHSAGSTSSLASPEVSQSSYILPKKEDVADVLYFYRYAELAYMHAQFKMVADPSILIHINDKNDIYKPPFYIAFDHEVEAVVVSIRGTYSAADVLSDLKFDLTAINLEGLRERGISPIQMTHSGMFKSAEYILQDVDLEKLKSILLDNDSEYYGYRLVVCGHSLGAGVAAILTWMLKIKGFENSQCYAYAPPGCMMSAPAAEYFESFCTSIVIGDDLVPRLSRNSVEVLKWEVGRLLSTCEMPKWRILGSVIGNWFRGSHNSTEKLQERRKKHRNGREKQSQKRKEKMKGSENVDSESRRGRGQHRPRFVRKNEETIELENSNSSKQTSERANSLTNDLESQLHPVSPIPAHIRVETKRYHSRGAELNGAAPKNRRGKRQEIRRNRSRSASRTRFPWLHYSVDEIHVLPMTNNEGKPRNQWVRRIMQLRRMMAGEATQTDRPPSLPMDMMYLPGKILYLEKLRRDLDFDENGVEYSPPSGAHDLLHLHQEPEFLDDDDVNEEAAKVLKPAWWSSVSLSQSEIMSPLATPVIEKQALIDFGPIKNKQIAVPEPSHYQGLTVDAKKVPTLDTKIAPANILDLHMQTQQPAQFFQRIAQNVSSGINKTNQQLFHRDHQPRSPLFQSVDVDDQATPTTSTPTPSLRARDRPLSHVTLHLLKQPNNKLAQLVQSATDIAMASKNPKRKDSRPTLDRITTRTPTLTPTFSFTPTLDRASISLEQPTTPVTPAITKQLSSASLLSPHITHESSSGPSTLENFITVPTDTSPSNASSDDESRVLSGVKVEIDKKIHGKYLYRGRWAAKEEFLEVVISRSCITDHFRFDLFRKLDLLDEHDVLVAEHQNIPL